MFSFLLKQFQWEFILITILNTVEVACRIGFSIMLQELLFKVSKISEGENKRDAYLYGVFCGVLWLIGLVSTHNAYS